MAAWWSTAPPTWLTKYVNGQKTKMIIFQAVYILPILKTNAQKYHSNRDESRVNRYPVVGRRESTRATAARAKRKEVRLSRFFGLSGVSLKMGSTTWQRTTFKGLNYENTINHLVPVFLPTKLPELRKVFPEPTVTQRAWEPREILIPGRKNLQNGTLWKQLGQRAEHIYGGNQTTNKGTSASSSELWKTRPFSPSTTSSGSAGKDMAATGNSQPNMSTTFERLLLTRL